MLGAVARALQLDDAEVAYLFDLARATGNSREASSHSMVRRVRPGIQRILDSFVGSPACVHNERTDILAANDLGRAFYSEIYDSGIAGGNVARFTFLDPRARHFITHWEEAADQLIAVLRGNLGRNPGDRGLSALIGELSAQSREFSTRWASYEVKYHRAGRKQLNHPTVGVLEVDSETMELPSDPRLEILVFFAEPESPTAERLSLLASWAATSDRSGVGHESRSAMNQD